MDDFILFLQPILNKEYGFSIIYFNIFIYILLIINLINCIFFINYSLLINLSNFKFFRVFSYLWFIFIFILLSLAGVPPLLSFIGKFLIFCLTIALKNIFYSIIICIMHMSLLYYYTVNIKYSNNLVFKPIFINKIRFIYINRFIIFCILLISFLQIFGFLVVEDIIIYILYMFI